MSTDELIESIDGLLHEPTQVHDRGVDLTVTEVYEIRDPGRIDFGGGELESPAVDPHERTWRNEDDDYQWWHLDAGQYRIEYNESIAGERPIILQPRDALLSSGAFHPTVTVADLPPMPIAVGGAGLKLKENGRMTTARLP